MGFYETLSTHYDEVFAVNAKELAFAAGLLAGRKRLLDIGCGTGNKTAHFAEAGRRVEGIDLDAAMIDKAALEHGAPGVSYRILDMLDVGREFAEGEFDAALCLGNTLVHLVEPTALEVFLDGVHAVLEPKGRFLIQILNYDRIVAKHVDSLPVIETPNVRFIRRYEWREGQMHFVTSLTELGNGETFHNDIVLRPLGSRDLSQSLSKAGFAETERFGSYAGAPFDADSFHLITLCEKG